MAQPFDPVMIALNALDVPVVIADHHGTIDVVNSAARNFLPGLPLVEGQLLPDRLAKVDAELAAKYSNLNLGGGAVEHELQIEGKVWRVVVTTCATGFVLRASNITAEITAKCALADARTDMDQACCTIAHDLRAPIRSIVGFSSLLASDYGGTVDDEGKDLLGRQHRAALRLAGMVDALAEFGRISTEHVTMRSLNISDLAAEAFQEMTLEDELDVDIEPNLTAQGDLRLVRTLIRHLASNALKFKAPDRANRIRVGSDRRGFFIRDHGVGFDGAMADRLFRPFVRLHDPRDFPGRGIGLACVRRIAELHGGNTAITAAPQQGATVWFSLSGR